MAFFVVLVMLIAVATPAHAYVDAGSGSYMLQMSLAGLLGVVFSIKLTWQRIMAFAFERLSRRPRSHNHEAA